MQKLVAGLGVAAVLCGTAAFAEGLTVAGHEITSPTTAWAAPRWSSMARSCTRTA
jgi:hypothetical protein